MKLTAISDTHGFPIPIKSCDVLVHAGDATQLGTESEVRAFFEWFVQTPAKHRIFVPGNHDFGFENHRAMFRAMVPEGVTLLIDESVIIDDHKFYGSPWSPQFNDWAFNLRTSEQLRDCWDMIPEDTDVLITHAPPRGILDKTQDRYDKLGENAGCRALAERVRVVKPKVHIFGHIHSGYGSRDLDGTLYVNASTCTERYKPTNAPCMVVL